VELGLLLLDQIAKYVQSLIGCHDGISGEGISGGRRRNR
jgi:hypothetical protein